MKRVIKRVLPAPVVGLARAVLGKIHHPNYPLPRRPFGNHGSALQCCIAYNRFGGYCVPLSSSHRHAVRTILSGDVWEPETIDFISKNCTGGDILHAGAYFGDFLPALSKACGSDAKVWAFEPNPDSYRCACITIMLNDLRNVELTNAGLGSERGSLPMRVRDESGRLLGGGSRVVEVADETKNGQFPMVEIMRLDDAVPPDRNVAILQLDVEGFEEPALAGGIKTIRRCKPILLLENLPETDWLAANILELGYKGVGKVHTNTILMAE